MKPFNKETNSMKNYVALTHLIGVSFAAICSIVWVGPVAFAAPPVGSPTTNESVKVNVDNYVRAETAFEFDRYQGLAGGINRWHHNRVPTPLDEQNVIRMNRDTLYSFAVVDISKGATLTIPDAGDRYLSVMVVNEDEYINKVFHEAGVHQLTVEEFDTPYVSLTARTLADPVDPDDIKAANALQDQLEIKSASAKPYVHPNYDQDSYKATFAALLELSNGVPDTKRMFGTKDEVSEVRHLLGAAFGWGGLPEYEAFYITKNQPRMAGKFQLTVKYVPVDGFWSISIYNKDGYFQENEFDSYSINNLTAKPNEDGSITVNFGTSNDGQENFLYVMDDWNYAVRLYRPRQQILDGSWIFPEPQPVE